MLDQEEAFLHEILLAPEDDSPRLIYADWLEERGDPRGEFIRLQCTTARPGLSDREFTEIRARETQLLSENSAVWLAPFQRIKIANPVFRRGFIEQVSLKAPDFLRVAAELFAASPILHALTLKEASGHVGDIVGRRELSRLIALDLSGNTLKKNDWRDLAEASHLSRLQSLNVSSTELSDSHFRWLADAPHLAQLTTLLARRNDLKTRAAEALASSPVWKKLRRLDLANNAFGLPGTEMLGTGRNLESLRILSLANNALGDAGAAAFVDGRAWKRLEEVSLRGNEIGDQGVRALLSGRFPELRWLNLSGNNYGAEWGTALRSRYGEQVFI